MAGGWPLMIYATNGALGVNHTRTSTAYQLRDTADVQPTPIETETFEVTIQREQDTELALTLTEAFEATI